MAALAMIDSVATETALAKVLNFIILSPRVDKRKCNYV
jgi:hypothetical protein